jgi:hypothetical protein
MCDAVTSSGVEKMCELLKQYKPTHLLDSARSDITHTLSV